MSGIALRGATSGRSGIAQGSDRMDVWYSTESRHIWEIWYNAKLQIQITMRGGDTS